MTKPRGSSERDNERSRDRQWVNRLIFIASTGTTTKCRGETYCSILDPYRKAAQVIEASDLDNAIIRPAWLHDRDEIDYDTTVRESRSAILPPMCRAKALQTW